MVSAPWVILSYASCPNPWPAPSTGSAKPVHIQMLLTEAFSSPVFLKSEEKHPPPLFGCLDVYLPEVEG